jgi:hypothetical protein
MSEMLFIGACGSVILGLWLWVIVDIRRHR